MISLSTLFALFTLTGVILMITAMSGNGSFGSVGINNTSFLVSKMV
jgi:hypothetical protein